MGQQNSRQQISNTANKAYQAGKDAYKIGKAAQGAYESIKSTNAKYGVKTPSVKDFMARQPSKDSSHTMKEIIN